MLIKDSLNWKSSFGSTTLPNKPSNFTCFYIQKYEGIVKIGSLKCPGYKNGNTYSNECIECEYFEKGVDNNGKNIT